MNDFPEVIIIDDFEKSTFPKTLRFGTCKTCGRYTILVVDECSLCIEKRLDDGKDE